MRVSLLLLALVLLPACSYPYAEYLSDAVTALCDRYQECGQLEVLDWTIEECLSLGETDTGLAECPGYDKGDAKDCVEQRQSVSCEDLLAGRGMDSCLLVCDWSE